VPDQVGAPGALGAVEALLEPPVIAARADRRERVRGDLLVAELLREGECALTPGAVYSF
jgi:hypothetical protein